MIQQQRFTVELLRTKTRPELKQILTNLGAGYNSREKTDRMIGRIIEISMAVQPSDKAAEIAKRDSDKAEDYKEPDMNPRPKPPLVTKEQVLEVIKNSLDKGMKAEFSDDGLTWHFMRYDGRNFLAEDSGSMRIPLNNIRHCANMLFVKGMGRTNIKRA